MSAAGGALDRLDGQPHLRFESLLTEIAADFASRSSSTLEAALVRALERLARFSGAALAALCEVSVEAEWRVTHWWCDPAVGTSPYRREFGPGAMPALVARLFANEAIVVSQPADLAPGLLPTEWLEARRLRSFVIVPINGSDGRLIALGLAAAPSQSIKWPAETVTVLRLCGAIVVSALGRLHADAAEGATARAVRDAQKLESLSVIAGGIAHDFNNLLTSILGHASLLKLTLPGNLGVNAHLDEIETASTRGADLCRQMLAFAGLGPLSRRLLPVDEVIRSAETDLRAQVHPPIELRSSLGAGRATVFADGAQLQQVLLNLVQNAAEAIGDRPGTVTIGTSVGYCTAEELAGTVFSPQLPCGRYVRLSVSDTGVGMAPGMVTRIFDPFFTTKFTGRGLGLAAVIGIVRAHRAALRVDTAPGAGSRFDVLLPAEPAG